MNWTKEHLEMIALGIDGTMRKKAPSTFKAAKNPAQGFKANKRKGLVGPGMPIETRAEYTEHVSSPMGRVIRMAITGLVRQGPAGSQPIRNTHADARRLRFALKEAGHKVSRQKLQALFHDLYGDKAIDLAQETPPGWTAAQAEAAEQAVEKAIDKVSPRIS